MTPRIRDEAPADALAVELLIARAFAPMPFSDGSEPAIARALRRDPAVIALVAEAGGRVLGQVMLSPATLDGAPSGWWTLGPLAVAPGAQRRGMGSALVTEALERLRAQGAAGCLVEGDPTYYGRFGFRPAPGHAPEGALPPYFQALPLAAGLPAGRFGWHPAFQSAPSLSSGA